jgi:hypothetical protein
VGDNLTVTAFISSDDNVSDQYSAQLKVDGTIKDAKEIGVIEGLPSKVVFSVQVIDTAEHELSIGDKTTKFKAITFDNKKPITIQYDGKGQGIANYMYTGRFVSGGSGHMVCFSAPTYPFKLTAVPMSASAVAKGHGSLQDKTFTVHIWDKNTHSLIWEKDYPWQLYGDASDFSTIWHDIPIPGVIVNNDFCVEVVTYSDQPQPMPGFKMTIIGEASLFTVDYEDTRESTNSSVSYDGRSISNPDWKGNWCIRAKGYAPLQ